MRSPRFALAIRRIAFVAIVWLLAGALNRCTNANEAPHPLRSKADYELVAGEAMVVYTKPPRNTRLFLVEADGTRKEILCGCRHSCSRTGIWRKPRKVYIEYLKPKSPSPRKRLLLLKISETDGKDMLNYSYAQCLR
jgi:hypothetical protein